MSATVSTRWFFADWLSDPCLRASSLAARGLWKDLLCIAAANKGRQYGLVLINSKPPSPEVIARIVQSTPEEVKILLAELSLNGVFSLDRNGVMYCRRMVRARKSRENGRLGGNPKLLNHKESRDPDNHPLVYSYPNPDPDPDPEPLRKKVRETLNGNGGGNGEKKRKPIHKQFSKKGRIWLDKGTEEFNQYAADYYEKHHASVTMLWSNSGAWFNIRGEQ